MASERSVVGTFANEYERCILKPSFTSWLQIVELVDRNPIYIQITSEFLKNGLLKGLLDMEASV